jgi:hypothetical protein
VVDRDHNVVSERLTCGQVPVGSWPDGISSEIVSAEHEFDSLKLILMIRWPSMLSYAIPSYRLMSQVLHTRPTPQPPV